jgi:prepilin-type N-terminal cleavage/methylation domain-containing protein
MNTLERFEQSSAIAPTRLPRLVAGERGFSLVELLVVVAIVSLLVSLMGPIVEGMASPSGRKGAVTIVMNTLEQARASAIQKGRDVVVVFWKKNGTGTEFDAQDTMIVLQWNEADTAWEPLSRWVKLPKGVLFNGEDSQSAIFSTLIPNADLDRFKLPGISNPSTLSAQLRSVRFTSTGAIQTATPPDTHLTVSLTEGQRAPTGDTMVVPRQKAGGREVISLARYTGRVTMDIVD